MCIVVVVQCVFDTKVRRELAPEKRERERNTKYSSRFVSLRWWASRGALREAGAVSVSVCVCGEEEREE